MAESRNLPPRSGGGRIDEATGTQFVGHEWDGIEELDTPMPRWWLWTFYLTILFSIGYVVVYPAIPLLNKGTDGIWGWSSRGQLTLELQAAEANRAEFRKLLAATPTENIADDPAMLQQAVAGGRAAFLVNCVQCHGSGAAGFQDLGYPNLNDDDWLWGGDIKAIEFTLTHGIREPAGGSTRFNIMPAYGRDGLLDARQIAAVTDHVLSLSGKGRANAAGAQLFTEQCAICHGDGGAGLREFGAPNLADAIWLYGGERAKVARQINNPRHGVMPAWGNRLDPVTIKMLAAYVHSLGGGEDLEAVVEPAAEVDEQP